MQITISRRNLLKGAAATAVVASVPIAAAKVVAALEQPDIMVSLFDEVGNVLGSTTNVTKIVNNILDGSPSSSISYKVDCFDVIRTGTARVIKVIDKYNGWGPEYTFYFSPPFNHVVLGNIANIIDGLDVHISVE
jgi:hypothetical protein